MSSPSSRWLIVQRPTFMVRAVSDEEMSRAKALSIHKPPSRNFVCIINKHSTRFAGCLINMEIESWANAIMWCVSLLCLATWFSTFLILTLLLWSSSNGISVGQVPERGSLIKLMEEDRGRLPQLAQSYLQCRVPGSWGCHRQHT